jgi:hypothetical protein
MFSITMLSNFHFDIPEKYIRKNNSDNDTTIDILREESVFQNFKMVSPFEIIVFVWVFALFMEELKQVFPLN